MTKQFHISAMRVIRDISKHNSNTHFVISTDEVSLKILLWRPFISNSHRIRFIEMHSSGTVVVYLKGSELRKTNYSLVPI
jgi:hypothetical protein